MGQSGAKGALDLLAAMEGLTSMEAVEWVFHTFLKYAAQNH